MSTRSFIGKLNQDGTVDYTYCHWDGYCAGNGYILLAHADEQVVDDLLAEGWLSSIEWSEEEGRIKTTKVHDNPAERNVSLANYLDTKEHWGIEYFYLYDVTKQQWFVASVHASEFRLYPLRYLLTYELKKALAKGWEFEKEIAKEAVEKGIISAEELGEITEKKQKKAEVIEEELEYIPF